ncbi:hypothetical protein AALB81_05595 [Lachnospiraceae bacterium 48-33]
MKIKCSDKKRIALGLRICGKIRKYKRQDKMVQRELRVSEIKEYQNIAFFQYLIIRKDN